MALINGAICLSPASAPSFNITSAIPGRIRLQLKASGGRRERLHRWADWLQFAESFGRIDISVNSGSLILYFDPDHLTLDDVLAHIREIAVKADTLKPPTVLLPQRHGHKRSKAKGTTHYEEPAGSMEAVRAKDLPTSVPHGVRTMFVPTIAVALATFEVVPAALTIIAIAVSAAPTAKRVVNDLRRVRFSVDELDLLNVALATIDGFLFPAAIISWLINFGEVVRERTMASAREHHVNSSAIACTKCNHELSGDAKLMLENALISDTQFQGLSAKTQATAIMPFVGLAGLMAFGTQDLGFIVGFLKPIYDFSGAVRFGVPATLLRTMSHSAHHGPIFRNGRAVEKLAKVDAIVFFTTDGYKSNKVLIKRVRQLVNRGVNHFIMPTVAEAARVEEAAASLGKHYVVAEAVPADPDHAVEALLRHGHTVAVVEDGRQQESWLHRADIRIGMADSPGASFNADIMMTHADLKGIGHTIDLSRHSMEVARQNLAVSAAASFINLSLAFVPPLAATIVTTLTTAIIAANASRELTYDTAEAAEAEVTEPEHLEVRGKRS